MEGKQFQYSILKQILVLVGVLFCGEIINRVFIHFIPGSVLGMIILLLLLTTKVITTEYIDSVSTFLTKNLAFFFVVPGVSLLQLLPLLEKSWIKISLISIISTVIVMSVTGLVLQKLLEQSHE